MISGLLLALLTSALYGAANFLIPFLAARHSPAAVLLYSQAAAALATVAILVVVGGPAPDLAGFALAVAVGISNAVGLVGLIQATRYGPLAIVAPINASGAAAPAVVGLADGDPATPARLGGLLLALTGAIVVARSSRTAPAAPTPGWAMRRCLGWSLVSATGFGGLLVLLPPAVDAGGWWALLTIRGTVLAYAILAVTVGRGNLGPRPSLRGLAGLALPGLCLLAGTASYAAAATMAELSVVGVAGSLSAPITVALAFVILRERPTRSQIVGGAAAALGVALLALSAGTR